jgi:DNA-binding NarL/FixJ family response regulator
MRVLIAAQSVAMRLGLREMLSSLPDLEVSADAPGARDLSGVDVLVVISAGDIHLHQETRPVLLLTNAQEEAAKLSDLPVWGVLPLEASPEEISAALHALGEGLWVGSPALLASSLLERHPAPTFEAGEPVGDSLTGRELEVLQLAAEGLANKQIALALNISEHTVKFHLSSLYAKLGVTSRTEAIRAGVRQGRVVM